MKAIGGYPELELRQGEHYHKNALRLNTARNCLEYILLARQYKRVYLPYYTCAAVFEPFEKSLINRPEILYYHVDDNLDPVYLPPFKDGEAFLYTNYFGLKQDMVENLVKRYGNQLIVDNSQAFYDMPWTGIDTFYSARKFFGVPDGAYLYTDVSLHGIYPAVGLEQDVSYNRMKALLKRIDLEAEDGYDDFQKVEKSLEYQEIRKMSKLTEMILGSIDYEVVRERRRKNYYTLYWKLFQNQNLWFKLREEAVPLCYPFLTTDSSLRNKLIANRIYVPTYWPNVLNDINKERLEYTYTTSLLPLPIDQRYGSEEMNRIATIINSNK